jgi:hypothetical protein
MGNGNSNGNTTRPNSILKTSINTGSFRKSISSSSPGRMRSISINANEHDNADNMQTMLDIALSIQNDEEKKVSNISFMNILMITYHHYYRD